MYLRVLTREELKSVLVHEFAHLINGDTVFTRKLNGKKNKWYFFSQSLGNASFLLFAAISLKNIIEFEKFDFLSSYNKEVQADALVKEKSDSQAYIDATAKGKMFELNESELPDVNVYASETSAKDPSEGRYRTFMRGYELRREHWEYICENEIPARIDTHPTLAERMKFFGIEKFNVDFSKPEEALLKETEKIFARLDKFLVVEKMQWDALRGQNYLKPLKIIEKYENEEKDNLYDAGIIEAYIDVCQKDKALARLERMLEVHPRSAELNFYKGRILVDNYDASGIDYLVRAAEDNLSGYGDAIQIASFYLKNLGLREKRDALRDKLEKLMIDGIRYAPKEALRNTDKFYPSDLPEKALDEIRAELENYGIVTKAYIVKKKIKGFPDINVVALQLSSFEEEKTRIINRLFRFLEEREEQFLLYSQVQPVLMKKIRKVDKSLIYNRK
jgi:hypothetical protein